jgi:hypothetical protein
LEQSPAEKLRLASEPAAEFIQRGTRAEGSQEQGFSTCQTLLDPAGCGCLDPLQRPRTQGFDQGLGVDQGGCTALQPLVASGSRGAPRISWDDPKRDLLLPGSLSIPLAAAALGEFHQNDRIGQGQDQPLAQAEVGGFDRCAFGPFADQQALAGDLLL